MRRFIRALAIAAAIGCRSPSSTTDPRACQQTYEFGNTGCFEVAGQVVGSAGQALAGILVSARTVSDADVFVSDNASTDGAGRFLIRGVRMTGRAPAAPALDTLSIYVIALSPPSAVRDSVLAVVSVAAVGSVPQTATVRVPLPVPR